MKPKKVLAWHFLADKDGKPVLRDGSPAPAIGKVLCHPDAMSLCSSGLHASMRAIDALNYAPGPWLARVEVSGKIVFGEDKLVASERNIISLADVSKELHEFGVACAVRAMEKYGNGDERSYAAIDLKLGWLQGILSDEDIDAERAAAWAAAWAAAGAACSAAESAARSAARSAERSAAWAAAGAALSAAESAARSAAESAARDAEKTEQNKLLESMFKSALGIKK